jgi:hypothetical protein
MEISNKIYKYFIHNQKQLRKKQISPLWQELNLRRYDSDA